MSQSETRECNSAECNWTGPAGECVHPKHIPESLLCPLCNETTFVVVRKVSIEQHAEAAAKDIAFMVGWPKDIEVGEVAVLIQRHIDEATAPLRVRIAKLEGLGELIDVYGDYCEDVGRYDGHEEGMKKRETWREITAILAGGAP